MEKEIRVTKRDGSIELLDLNKIHTVLQWACTGLKDVSISDIEMKSKIQFYDKIRTESIHNTLIKSAGNLISEQQPNYQYVAARLLALIIRKKAINQFDPIPVKELVERNIKLGVYDNELLNAYSDDEWNELENIIVHERDFQIAYAGMKQWEGKNLVQNRTTHEFYETPQYAYLVTSLATFIKYPKNTRMGYIKKAYNLLSNFDISLPTPITAGLRTPVKQYASCVKVECGDSLDSINATSNAIVKYVAQKAGLGIGAGQIRAMGSMVGNGYAVHTGVIPFYKLFAAAVRSASQGGIRSGSATLNVIGWHLEIEDILVLKNNKGTEENRVRQLDYSIQVNGFMLNRLIKGEKITLFSPNDVPGLYDAFFNDQDKFAELYVKYEQDKNIRKRKIYGVELFTKFLTERFETGRIYYTFTDHINNHSAFLDKITLSNLCQEISLPTKALIKFEDREYVHETDENNDELGEIALCVLAAVNIGTIKTVQDMEERCDILVRILDEVIDLQKYPVLAAARSTINRRSLGIGVINYAYYLAKNGASYDESGFKLTNEVFEALEYYSIKASVNLAKEKGKCNWFHKTKYSKGILPIDTYKKDIDELVGTDLLFDWEQLRKDVLEYGMRNSCITAQFPAETSAQLCNATNGIEPVMNLITVKGSKNSMAKQVAPESTKLKNKYDYAWDMKTNDGYIKLVGIMTKYLDQSVSSNVYYNPNHWADGKIPLDVLMSDFLKTYKYGWKTAYYSNVYDGKGESADIGCESGACQV